MTNAKTKWRTPKEKAKVQGMVIAGKDVQRYYYGAGSQRFVRICFSSIALSLARAPSLETARAQVLFLYLLTGKCHVCLCLLLVVWCVWVLTSLHAHTVRTLVWMSE